MNKEQLESMGAHVIDLADPLPKGQSDEMSLKDWEALGTKLFGEDRFRWRFVCPSCKHVQTPEDFRAHKTIGATPDTAYHDCIGRWEPEAKGTMYNGKQPCDYTLGGLFKLSQRVVISETGTRVGVFLFDGEAQ